MDDDYYEHCREIEKAIREIVITENDGRKRRFRATVTLCAPYAVLAAAEVNGGYRFEEICISEDELEECFKRLQLQIVKGVNCKSLKEIGKGNIIENAIERNGRNYILKDSGIMRIVEEDDGSIAAVIDGYTVSMQELERLLGQYCNFNMNFSFSDITQVMQQMKL